MTGEEFSISGGNFGNDPMLIRVFFNNQEITTACHLDTDHTLIKCTCPTVSGSPPAGIKTVLLPFNIRVNGQDAVPSLYPQSSY